MTLISLYIENFGGLSGYELIFEQGLTTINQPNGFGKTTLAEFIRTMFYGFPRKSKTLEKSRRQKYAPWNGGAFGGYLIFEYEGQRYRLERTFGTTPKGDTFTLIDLATNRKTSRFSEEIGAELFQLDADSFERSTYLPQMWADGPLATASIQAKLSALVEDGSDMANFDKAIATLRAKRSALVPYRGSGGTVAEAAGKITQLQVQLDQLLQQRDRIGVVQDTTVQTEEELKRVQAALAQVLQELSTASEAAASSLRRDQYEQLRQRFSQVEGKIAALQAQYPAGFPDMPALCSAETAAEQLAALENQVITTPADLQAQAVLRDNRYFENHLPTQSELDTCRRNCEEFSALQQKIHNAELAHAEQIRKERETLALQPATTGSVAVTVVWLLCALGLAAGTAMMVMKRFLYGYIGLGFGLGFMIAALLMMHIRKKRQHTRNLQYRRESDERIAAAQQEMELLRQRSEKYRVEISRFLADYGIEVPPQHFFAGQTRLEHNVLLFEQARQQAAQWQSRKEKQEAELTLHRRELETFFARYGQKMGDNARAQLRQMRDEIYEVRSLLAQKRELSDQLTAFWQAHAEQLSAPPIPVKDAQALKQQEENLRDTLTALTEKLLRQKQELQHLRMQTDRIPQLQEELEHWQHQRDKGRENARILDDTMDFLHQAREKLSTSYLGTIQSRFGHYLSKLEGTSGEKFLIDTDFQVQLERLGQAREMAYFSAGQTDLVMLCMRLALVDALFKGQEMFVILDDPFVNLDDVHTAQALELLQTLASERQILYLTCHSSRAI